MKIIEITSINNQMVKDALKILRGNYKKEQIFMVEGFRMVKDCIDNQVKIKHIFIRKDLLDKYAELFQQMEDLQLNVYAIDEKIHEKMGQTNSSQGIFAVVEYENSFNITEKLEKKECFLCLDGIQDPGNLGTILRTAIGFGVRNIFITADSVKFFSPKVIRSTMGGIFKANIMIVPELDQTLEAFLQQGYEVIGTCLGEESQALPRMKVEKPWILVMGNEANGIRESVTKKLTQQVIIPMEEGTESLNVAVATGIVLWEMMK